MKQIVCINSFKKGEWEETGLYIARNGQALDADFLAFITLSYMAGAQKIVSSGKSTFVMGNNSILGQGITIMVFIF